METAPDQTETQLKETVGSESQQTPEEHSAIDNQITENDFQIEDLGKPLSHEERNRFVHGLLVGIGMGSVAAFAIVWASLFFIPQIPSHITYENLLAVFIYPLIYLLAVGLVATTAGIVREYYVRAHDQ